MRLPSWKQSCRDTAGPFFYGTLHFNAAMYSDDLRIRAIKLYLLQDYTYRGIERLIDIGKSTIHRWVKNSPLVQRKERRRLIEKQCLASMKLYISQHPFCTCDSLKEFVKTKLGIKVSRQTIHSTIKRLKFSLKHPSKVPNTQDLDSKRRAWALKNSKIHQNSVAIDETAFYVDCQPTKGYAPVGQRLPCQRKSARCNRKRLSVLMAVTTAGVLKYEILDGSFNSTRFASFLQDLQPLLQTQTHLVMDNVRFHHSAVVKDVVTESGLTAVYTPPYTPDFNPIEVVFAHIKRYYKRLQDPNTA